MAHLIGVSDEVLNGKPIRALDPSASDKLIADMKEHLQQCIDAKQIVEYEQRSIIDQQETWWLVRLEPLFNEAGEVDRVVSTAIPITARKQAQMENDLLFGISRAVSEAKEFDEALQRVVDEICEHTDQTLGEVWLPNAEGSELV